MNVLWKTADLVTGLVGEEDMRSSLDQLCGPILHIVSAQRAAPETHGADRVSGSFSSSVSTVHLQLCAKVVEGNAL